MDVSLATIIFYKFAVIITQKGTARVKVFVEGFDKPFVQTFTIR